MGSGEILVYVTYITAIKSTATKCERICNWFDALKIQYTKVDLGMVPEKRQEMEAASGGKKVIPQVHIDNKFVGDFEIIEEQVENDYLFEFLRSNGYAGPGLSKVAQ